MKTRKSLWRRILRGEESKFWMRMIQQRWRRRPFGRNRRALSCLDLRKYWIIKIRSKWDKLNLRRPSANERAVGAMPRPRKTYLRCSRRFWSSTPRPKMRAGPRNATRPRLWILTNFNPKRKWMNRLMSIWMLLINIQMISITILREKMRMNKITK